LRYWYTLLSSGIDIPTCLWQKLINWHGHAPNHISMHFLCTQ
jgi:hypothetical protein